jgi:hypothetical protein
MWKRWWSRAPTETAGDGAGTPASRARPGFSAEDEELLARIADAVVRWGMTAPAVFLLESSKPLNFVGSQFLHFLSPIANAVLDARQMDRLAVLLERRDTMEALIVRIERAEAARETGRRKQG